MNYKDFLKQKLKHNQDHGFEIDGKCINKNAFDFQKQIIIRSLKLGRFCVFADCGLGKTLMQLETGYQIARKTNKPILILAPLAVTAQTEEEAEKFNIDTSKIDIVNYEQLHNIDASKYVGVILDESSILKNFQGKFRNKIINSFRNTKYKLCYTATPSPNDPMELGNHSEFIGAMSRLEMLAMYFVHDGGNTSKWRLKKHGFNKFYDFISKWAVMFSKPSDIGFSDKGYELLPLNFHEHQVTTDKRKNGLLFNDVAVSATNFNKELRATMDKRLDIASEICNVKSMDQHIVWVKQNEESKRVTASIDGAYEVKGSDHQDKKKEMLLGFAKKEFRVLVTKFKIAQFGLNFQNCSSQVVASLDFSFEGLYQAIRRSYRFGQKKPVDIHLITTDTMKNVIQGINEKRRKFEAMQAQMIRNQNYLTTLK